MFLAYCDEQDCHERKYSAAIACVFQAGNAPLFREHLVSGMRRIFNRAPDNASPFPTLHASKLPADLDDEGKIDLFRHIIEGVKAHCSLIYRIGYSWEDPHMSGFAEGGLSGKTSNRIIGCRLAAYSHLRHELAFSGMSPIALIQELDHRNFNSFDSLLNFTSNIEKMLQFKSITGKSDFAALENVIGYFYTSKRDHLTYAADFSAYLLKIQSERDTSEFKKKLLMAAPDISSIIVQNRIVPPRPL